MANLSRKFRNCLLGRELDLTEKLALAAEAVPRLIKKGEHPEYNYLRISDVADAFWGELRKRGLLVIPNDLESGFLDANNAWVKTQFIVTDGKTTAEFVSFGQGFSHEGHALHIAQSTALKSWLKRLGMTFGEEDDQEVSVSPYTPPRELEQHPAVARYQQRAWAEALKGCNKTPEQIETYLSTAFGFEVKAEDITKLSASDFDIAVTWLKTNGDLGDTLELSKIAAKAKKNGKGPQAVVPVLDKKAPDEIATA